MRRESCSSTPPRPTHSICRSVGRSVGLSVCLPVGLFLSLSVFVRQQQPPPHRPRRRRRTRTTRRCKKEASSAMSSTSLPFTLDLDALTHNSAHSFPAYTSTHHATPSAAVAAAPSCPTKLATIAAAPSSPLDPESTWDARQRQRPPSPLLTTHHAYSNAPSSSSPSLPLAHPLISSSAVARTRGTAATAAPASPRPARKSRRKQIVAGAGAAEEALRREVHRLAEPPGTLPTASHSLRSARARSQSRSRALVPENEEAGWIAPEH